MGWKFSDKTKKDTPVNLEKSNNLPNQAGIKYMKTSPCEVCGACCSFFRVSFPDTETDDTLEGIIPYDMTLPLKGCRRFMKGTETNTPRCIALQGNVGFNVKCAIYENRPSTCRIFNLSWENDISNFQCDRARAAFGLQPFTQY